MRTRFRVLGASRRGERRPPRRPRLGGWGGGVGLEAEALVQMQQPGREAGGPAFYAAAEHGSIKRAETHGLLRAESRANEKKII